MAIEIKPGPGIALIDHRSSTFDITTNMPTLHPIQQLDEVIKLAETADPPFKVLTLLRPIQENIRVQEQHYEDGWKDRYAEVLALKLKLSQAHSKAEEQEESLVMVKEKLRGAKTEIRRLRRDAMLDLERMQGLETDRTTWMQGNGGRIGELERIIRELKADRGDLQQTIASQRDSLFKSRSSNIAQRGEIHFLKQDIEHLKDKVEMNKAATEWLAENGPSLKADFFSMRNEVTKLRERGHQVARLMARGAKKWERNMADTDSVTESPKHLNRNSSIDAPDYAMRQGSNRSNQAKEGIDKATGGEVKLLHTRSGKRRRMDETDSTKHTEGLYNESGSYSERSTNNGDLSFQIDREEEEGSNIWCSMSPDPR